MTTLPSGRSSIFIVDDDPTEIKILVSILSDDYDMHYTTSGHQALTILTEKNKPDLILLDVMMPVMNGYELCALLKKNADTLTIPIIFITAKSDAESETQALSMGAVDFIHKPINREVVRARVKVHIEAEQRVQALHLANTELTEWNSNLKSRVLQQTALVRQKVEEANQQFTLKNKARDEIQNTPSPSLSPPKEKPVIILCVDDEENVLHSLTRLFRKEPFQVITATSGEAGLAILKKHDNVGLILSDHRMPNMTGTDFLQTAATISPDSSRMILTGHADMNIVIGAINQGKAICFMTKPWNDNDLIQTVRDGLDRYQLLKEERQEKDDLAQWNNNLKGRLLQQTALVRQKTEEAHQQHDQKVKSAEDIVLFLADLMDQRHRRLSSHARTVAALATSMVKHLELPQPQGEEIIQGALLHDIGLIGMSDRLLINNMEFLSGTDMSEYRDHPVKGQELIENFEELRGIGHIIRHHHEAFDGSGFPDGLAGNTIPLGGQIIHLASFIESNFAQAPGTDAVYKVSKKLALNMGTLFNPALFATANYSIKDVLSNQY